MSQGFAKPINSDHGELLGLADDDHTQYALLPGRSGGQSFVGGSAASENLSLSSTSDLTKGNIVFEDGCLAQQFIDFEEIATPSNPGSDVGRLYVGDDGGTTSLFFRDSSGVETNLLGSSPAGSDGEIQFNDSGSLGSNALFFWDDLNERLGVGNNSPQKTLHLSDSQVTMRVEELRASGGASFTFMEGFLTNTTDNLSSQLISFGVRGNVNSAPTPPSATYGFLALAPNFASDEIIKFTDSRVGIGVPGIFSPVATLDVRGSTIINQGNDSNADLTCRGTTENNLLRVDASQNKVGIGALIPVRRLHIKDSSSILSRYEVERTSGGVVVTFFEGLVTNPTGPLSTQFAVIGALGNVNTAPTPPSARYVFIGAGPGKNQLDNALRMNVDNKCGINISGSADPSAFLEVNGDLALKSTTPAQITSDQNNYSSLDDFSLGRLSSDASRTITGIKSSGSADGRILRLVNVGANDITISHESASSLSRNRIIMKSGADVVLSANDVMTLIWDDATDRWREF